MARSSLLLSLLLVGCAGQMAEQPRASIIREVSASPSASGTCAPLDWPVFAIVSSAFGRRDGREHTGIDLAVPEGTPVHAACDGVVTYAGERLRGYGRLVIVEHGGGMSTFYAHNSALEVQVGSQVRRGQVLSRSGATGHVTAAHLHFEVRNAGVAVDPMGLLQPRPATLGIGYALGSALHADPSPP